MNNRQLNSVISICSSTLKMKYIPSWAQKICSSNSSSHDLNSRDCIPCLMFSNVEHPSPSPPSILAQFEAKNVQNNNSIVFFFKKIIFVFLKKVFSFAFFCDDPNHSSTQHCAFWKIKFDYTSTISIPQILATYQELPYQIFLNRQNCQSFKSAL